MSHVGSHKWLHSTCIALIVVSFLAYAASKLAGQTVPTSDDPRSLYQQLQRAGEITESTRLENVVLQKDRVTVTLTGMIYFPAPVGGKIRSAVFIGTGTFHAPPPPALFEKDNLRRLLKADDVSSDFKTAVFRFTDNTGDQLQSSGVAAKDQSRVEQAQRLANELSPRLLKETGMNIAARQLESIINHESPGIFLAQMDGGKRGRFTYLFDPQSRIPVSSFGINAGEKGLIFAYDDGIFSNDVWMAFHANEDYVKMEAPYSDAYDLVDIPQYAMKLDLLEPKKVLGLETKLDLICRQDGVRIIPFAVGEGLDINEAERRKKQLQVLTASLGDGTPLTFFQEPWEAGFTLVLPKSLQAGQHLSISLGLKGDFMKESDTVYGTYFPRSTETWYPRHGYLSRSKFDITILHRKKDNVVSIGERVKENPVPDAKDEVLTEFRHDYPVALATFAVGPYEIHRDIAKQESGKELPLEFYSMPAYRAVIKEDFILAEMNNSVRFFSKFFGEYPYPLFRGAYHPFSFGQGFATTIMIPKSDSSTFRTFSFIAHETSHQWWGDMVLWRSYRDQWLSEGFAEYSGMLYVQFRDGTKSEKQLIRIAREDLKMPPSNLTGIGKGRLVDVGPLVLGRRLESRETGGAYEALTYGKGALVLRMLHFLFTDPQTGNGDAFFKLMADFVERYKGDTASTREFLAMASDRLKDTALAKRFRYEDLNWFYRQWVTQTYLPSYELSYHLETGTDGSVILKGDVYQKGLPENETWFMPLPLRLEFPGKKVVYSTVAAMGEHAPVAIRLPERPEKVELDPDMWILSDKTSTVVR